jgi:hypothetical protein
LQRRNETLDRFKRRVNVAEHPNRRERETFEAADPN